MLLRAANNAEEILTGERGRVMRRVRADPTTTGRLPALSYGVVTVGVSPIDFNFFVDELFVGFVGSGQLERVRDVGFALGDARDHVRTADPVGFREIGWRPLRGMIGVRVVEADDVFVAVARLALDAH